MIICGINIILNRMNFTEIEYLEQLLPKDILAEIKIIEKKSVRSETKEEVEPLRLTRSRLRAKRLSSNLRKSNDSESFEEHGDADDRESLCSNNSTAEIFTNKDYPFLMECWLASLGIFIYFVIFFTIELYFLVNYCTNMYRVMNIVGYIFLVKPLIVY